PEAMYYVDAAGVVTRLVTGFIHPNGVILSPDGGTLYLALEGEKRIMAYDVTAPGVLANPRQFARSDVTTTCTTIPAIFNGLDHPPRGHHRHPRPNRGRGLDPRRPATLPALLPRRPHKPRVRRPHRQNTLRDRRHVPVQRPAEHRAGAGGHHGHRGSGGNRP